MRRLTLHFKRREFCNDAGMECPCCSSHFQLEGLLLLLLLLDTSCNGPAAEGQRVQYTLLRFQLQRKAAAQSSFVIDPPMAQEKPRSRWQWPGRQPSFLPGWQTWALNWRAARPGSWRLLHGVRQMWPSLLSDGRATQGKPPCGAGLVQATQLGQPVAGQGCRCEDTH